jgi:outer membrane protein
MRNKAAVYVALAIAAAAASSAAAEPRELSVGEALLASESASPELKGAAAAEAQAQDAVEIAKSPYYPTLDAEGIDSKGFPGSNGALGLGGITSSPFRIGPTGALVSQLTVFDAGRSHALDYARSRLEAARARTRVVRYQVDQAALRIYIEGSRYKGQKAAWVDVGKRIDGVLKEVHRLVRTGQHSPVEGWLVQDQAEDAAMTAAVFETRYRIAVRRLALLTGLPEAGLSFPVPAALTESSMSVISAGTSSPSLDRAQAEADAAHKLVSQRKSENYPVITALASVGAMQDARLVQENDYSVGVGLRLPLFSGYRISSEIARSKDAAAERDLGVLGAKLELDEADASYDEVIESSRVKLRFLDQEAELARKAFDLALKRYLSFEGPLVDVRESIRNIARIDGELNDAGADLMLALGAKAVLNGGRVH